MFGLKKKKRLKKIKRHQSQQQKFFRKYGLSICIFFIFAILYFSWIYAVPFVLNQKITATDINSFLEPKIGFDIDYSASNYYTTPMLAVGVKFKNLKVLYPGANLTDDEGLFLKARAASIEMPVVPFLMKTIKFNEFNFRTVNVNLYQDSKGKFAYIDHIVSHFNPQMPKYMFELPEIQLAGYCLTNYNQQTNTFKKERGNLLKIRPAEAKVVLQKSKNARTIMLR